jgi:hypothetical protein
LSNKIDNLIHELDSALRAQGRRRGVLLGNPVSEGIILGIESQLKITFPDDYRAFLKSYGYIGIADAFFFGIWVDEPDSTSDGSVLGETIKLRKNYNLPHYLVPFYGRESYAYACMNCSPVDTGHKIVDFSPPIGEIQAAKSATSFQEYLEEYLGRRLRLLNSKKQ